MLKMVSESNKGFTIVEILIVIVVIAILAAISIIAYNGIQSRSRDASLDASLSVLKKGIELYNAKEGVYPAANTCADNSGCSLNLLTPVLVPEYISAVPSNIVAKASYARNTNGSGYGINIAFETKPQCVAGTNPNNTWGWFTSTNLPKC